jgi:SulP family sulfate permease
MLLATLLFSDHLIALFYLIPFAILGVLLMFAGGQLALTIMDLTTRSELFVVVVMLAVTFASNLAYASCVGLLLYWIIRRQNLDV